MAMPTNSAHHGNPTAFEVLRVVELRAKHGFSRRVELSVFVPQAEREQQPPRGAKTGIFTH
jgi:hypothetical protein